MWVVLFAISMMFAAFTSALVVRKGSSLDWRSFSLPSILFFNTLVLFASSVTLEFARRRIAAFMGNVQERVGSPSRWLYVTLCLGGVFVAGHYIAWSQVRARGLYLARNPRSSLLYVLILTHSLHVTRVLGGGFHMGPQR